MATGLCFDSNWCRCTSGPQLSVEPSQGVEHQIIGEHTMITFDLRLARQNFNLNVEGEIGRGITAVFGPSGAGKSTLLSALSGSTRPDHGSIKLNDDVLFSSEDNTWLAPERRRIGVVYQDGALFPHLSARKNIEFGYKLTPAEERKFQPDQLISLLGLSQLIERKPDQLSGGERQRVAIARAIAASPKILLLDEPLASLDVARKMSILAYLKQIHEKFELPMVYVSHSISEVVNLADTVIRMRDGEITGTSTSVELLLGNVPGETDIEKYSNQFEAKIVDSSGDLGLVEVDGVKISTPKLKGETGDTVILGIGANQLIVSLGKPERMSARNVLPGDIKNVSTENGRAYVEVDAGPKLLVELTENAVNDLDLKVGMPVHLVFKSSNVEVYLEK